MNDDTSKASETPETSTPEVSAPAATQDYFFPQHGMTIAAPSREEAEKKLADLLANKT